MSNKQIRTRKRVVEHGEVFTSEREVNAMLDLVKQETERIDSRFLEPACGNGNFLVEILNRKLSIVKERYEKNPLEFEKYCLVAVSSIYGVDILQDNVEECKKRLFEIFDLAYTETCKKESNDQYRDVIKYIFNKNIVSGNALTMKTNDDAPIIFSEWTLVMGSNIKRRDYRLDEILEIKEEQNTIFMNDADKNVISFIPKPIIEFPMTNFRKVNENE